MFTAEMSFSIQDILVERFFNDMEEDTSIEFPVMGTIQGKITAKSCGVDVIKLFGGNPDCAKI